MNTADRYSRQSFLGIAANEILANLRVAIVGLGGGGSHIVQQLAHVGVKNFLLVDPDIAEPSNLNRLIGARESDLGAATKKVEIATRMINGLVSDARVIALSARWEDAVETLRGADLLFGCLDSFQARADIERFARRYVIPLIDIGLDVHRQRGSAPTMGGQLIVSLPGGPCMWCLNFLNEQTLAREVTNYGAAGIRPQVVWANGVLASAAVGAAVDLVTGWSGKPPSLWLEYDANAQTLQPPTRAKYLALDKPCPHFPLENVEMHGDAVFRSR